MMSGLLALCLGLQDLQGQSIVGRLLELPSYAVSEKRIAINIPDDKLSTPKIAPQHKWEFDWAVYGFGRKVGGDVAYALRTRVFSERRVEDDKSERVARMAMRLWDFNINKLRLDHSPAYNNRVVDFYLCWGGKAGGEQRFDIDEEVGVRRHVNTIYIYDMPSFNNPIEMAREVAHEYGHATLPPVGGFKEPEDWAAGYLGEKLYLRWLRDEIAAKRLSTDDAAGAELATLDAWVKSQVNPLVDRVKQKGPDAVLLAGTGAAAMNAYMGLALYSDSILPNAVFARSLLLIGSTEAKDYPAAVVAAVDEAKPFAFALAPVPTQTLWLPVGSRKLVGATIVKRQGGWALVKVSAKAISLR